jgi:hypothetical protein
MRKSQRYLVAKYTPDPRRMEPRNIGVVLWAAGRAVARFLDEEDAYFVRDRPNYRRWVAYWQSLIEEQRISLPRKPIVTMDRPEFLDAMLGTQEGNYLLFDGGFVMDAVRRNMLPAAVDHLFRELVIRNSPEPMDHKEQAARLKAECDRALADVGLAARDDFKKSVRVPCKVKQVKMPFKFNYAIVADDAARPGRVRAVFQRVYVGGQQSVTSAAFMYQQLIRAKLLRKEQCAALISQEAGMTPSADAAASVQMLEEHATVINIADARAAREKLQEVADKAVA